MTMYKVPWELPSVVKKDLDAISKLYPYNKATGENMIQKFERQLADYVGCRHAIMVNNGSSAIVCALLATGVRPGHKVAVPTYTFASVVNSILLIGAKPILVDSEINTFNMDINNLERIIERESINAVIHVDVAGQPADLDKLLDICRARDIALIEDGAEALGTFYKGRMIGKSDHATTVSFHPAKQMTTLEGGAILTDNERLADKIRRVRNHEMSSKYEHVELGFNFRITPFEAAIGSAQLERIDEFIKNRIVIAEQYRKGLGDLINYQKIMPYVTRFSWGAFLVLLSSSNQRDLLLRHLHSQGIEARIMWKPVHLQDYHSKILSFDKLPIAEKIFATMLSLPIGNGMPIESTNYVIETIRNFFETN